MFDGDPRRRNPAFTLDAHIVVGNTRETSYSLSHLDLHLLISGILSHPNFDSVCMAQALLKMVS